MELLKDRGSKGYRFTPPAEPFADLSDPTGVFELVDDKILVSAVEPSSEQEPLIPLI